MYAIATSDLCDHSTAVDKIKQLSFRTRQRHVIELTESFLSLVEGLNTYTDKLMPSLESEWILRFAKYSQNNPNENLEDCLIATLLDSRLPYLRVTNSSNYRWSPFDMSFRTFLNGSSEIEVSLETVSHFKMKELLGIGHA